MVRLSLILVGCALGAATTAEAAPRRSVEPAAVCRFEGWSNDSDKLGQPVRAAPDAAATVVGRLPPPVNVGFDELSVSVVVTGYRDGWFRVDEAAYSDEVQGVRVPRSRVMNATGWVPVGGVKSLIAARELKAEPSREAATVAELAGFRRDPSGGRIGFGPDSIAVKRLLSCRGGWVELETEFGRGWVEKVCARQLSACP